MDSTTNNPSEEKSLLDLATSKLYQTIMTPINFITFIISLYIVSGRNQQKRIAMHPPSHRPTPAWLPSWLHGIIYRPQPYSHVPGDDNDKKARGVVMDNPPNYSDERFYYHTKQRKIMKLEAADAFELRSSVLGALCIAGVALVWVLACLGNVVLGWALGSWRRTMTV